jgi:osmotically-inducible protein OsmY
MNADRQLQRDVLSELSADPSVDAEHIGVAVNGKVVTLSGKVNSFFEKWSAEKAALRVLGVQGLTIEIDVKIPNDHQRTDEDLARSINTLLGWNTAIPKDAIKVMIESGWVTLSGAVPWNYQREIAHKVVVGLAGVRGITDQIALKPSVSGANIKNHIDEALKRQAILGGKKIFVKVDGGQVTLDGTVSSWTERDVIKHVVWATSGVQSLVDRMRYESTATA